MKQFLLSILFMSVFITNTHAQLDSCNVFLQGNYLEVGIAPNGSFGSTTNAPAGYYSMPSDIVGSGPFAFNACDSFNSYKRRNTAIGFIADIKKDGWATGSPAFYGDYVLPGTPQEGWAISVNDSETKAYNVFWGTSFSSGFSRPGITGQNISYNDLGSAVVSIWSGTYEYDSTSKLAITQTTSINKNSLYTTVNIILKNIATDTLHNIYYMRTLDPDNDETISGDYSTRNIITRKLPNLSGNVVITSKGLHDTSAYCALATLDCRVKAFIGGSIFPANKIKDIYAGTASNIYYDSATMDYAIGLIYNIGNLAPGDSTRISFAYVFKPAEVDSYLAIHPTTWISSDDTVLHSSGDTITHCIFSNTIKLRVNNNAYDNWSWLSLSGHHLSALAGPFTTLFVNDTTAVIWAIGSSSCAIRTDTVKIVIKFIRHDSTSTISIIGPTKKDMGYYVTVNAIVYTTSPSSYILWKKNNKVITATSAPSVTFYKSYGNDTVTALLHPAGCYDSVLSNKWIIYDPAFVGQINNYNGITLSPNPFNNNLTVSGLTASDIVTIYDLMGKKVNNWRVISSGNNNFNTSRLLPGMYILSISDKNGYIKTRLPMQKL